MFNVFRIFFIKYYLVKLFFFIEYIVIFNGYVNLVWIYAVFNFNYDVEVYIVLIIYYICFFYFIVIFNLFNKM